MNVPAVRPRKVRREMFSIFRLLFTSKITLLSRDWGARCRQEFSRVAWACELECKPCVFGIRLPADKDRVRESLRWQSRQARGSARPLFCRTKRGPAKLGGPSNFLRERLAHQYETREKAGHRG